jgi:hypothetical protein
MPHSSTYARFSSGVFAICPKCSSRPSSGLSEQAKVFTRNAGFFKRLIYGIGTGVKFRRDLSQMPVGMPAKRARRFAFVYFPAAIFGRFAFKRAGPFKLFFPTATSLEINPERFFLFLKCMSGVFIITRFLNASSYAIPLLYLLLSVL